jgi:hypothetical protein
VVLTIILWKFAELARVVEVHSKLSAEAVNLLDLQLRTAAEARNHAFIQSVDLRARGDNNIDSASHGVLFVGSFCTIKPRFRPERQIDESYRDGTKAADAGFIRL